MSTIIHFEIPADDPERARRFYQQLLGWKIEKAGMEGMEYWLIETGDEGALGGGLMRRQHPQQQILDYFDVPSLDDYAAKVQSLGGQVIVSKTPVPGMGFFCVCMDTENNAFALWETNQQAA